MSDPTPNASRLLAHRRSLLLASASLASTGVAAQAPSASAAAPAAGAAAELPLFAVEVKAGPKWDTAKVPPEQAFFREHSAHLRKLREAGHIRLGARYADKGLIVLAASTIDEVRGWIDADPSMQHGTFAYELHPFAVFYGGSVAPARRR